ncbi:hypothetical protein FEE96_05595 [Parasedimentitalea maritima]|uniref:LysR substrate-binding domain-containing protein n=1 Tax=Parasedimentitalea maritima TaxID=2578117 RepID=A0ABY2UZ26_9RHOB|nr:hypothetical protein FEE96_05595 [Zongyanglinia marina]
MGIETAKDTSGPKFEFHSYAIGAASCGIGIALISDLVVQREIDSGDLIIPFGGRTKFEDGYFFVYPPKMKNDVNAQTFGLWLQQQCASFLAINPLHLGSR